MGVEWLGARGGAGREQGEAQRRGQGEGGARRPRKKRTQARLTRFLKYVAAAWRTGASTVAADTTRSSAVEKSGVASRPLSAVSAAAAPAGSSEAPSAAHSCASISRKPRSRCTWQSRDCAARDARGGQRLHKS